MQQLTEKTVSLKAAVRGIIHALEETSAKLELSSNFKDSNGAFDISSNRPGSVGTIPSSEVVILEHSIDKLIGLESQASAMERKCLMVTGAE